MTTTTTMATETTMNNTLFHIRAYGWQELAILYHPLVAPKTAMKRFNRWVRHHPCLVNELESLGWRKGTRLLTPLMVEAIVRGLGEP